MIFDSLKNSALYENVHPRMKRAFEVLATTDWTREEPGVREIEGRDLYVNVMERELKKKGDAKLEVHDKYIDIQLLVSGSGETFGWSERKNLRQPQAPFNLEKDIQFFEDEPQTYYTMHPGQFSVLFPEDGHAPLVGEGKVRKVVVKVRL